MRNSMAPRKIRFRNGVQEEINYSQYVMLKDWFIQLKAKSATVEKTGDVYTIKTPTFSLQTSAIVTTKPFFSFLEEATSQGWRVKQTGNTWALHKDFYNAVVEQIDTNMYNITDDGVKIVGPVETLLVYFCDCLTGQYDADYRNKTVLDVGAFCGETAVYFSAQGASKVILYEPVTAHHKLIAKNLQANHVNAEVHEEGIGAETSVRTVHFDSLNIAFGLTNKGQNQTMIKIRNVSDVLLESKADIAKIDCEGAETSLIDVSAVVLRKISFYFIEAHNPEIQKTIIKKFAEAGFEMNREPMQYNKQISMLYFKRK